MDSYEPTDLEEVDITFWPEIVKAKGFRSVPVVEADGRYWVGNATTAQLVEFVTKAQEKGMGVRE